jgi:glycosyltransferase involved in cell wall biosynthesis
MIAETVAVGRLVRRFRPDVIHAHWLIPQGLAALVAGGRVPMLATTLGGDLYGLRDPVSRRITRAVVRRATAVTTMNEEMRQQLIALGAEPSRCLVLPMGAKTEAVRRRAKMQERVSGRLLFVGRLVEKKGLAVLIDAVRQVGDRGFELCVVGDGPLRGELETRAQGLPVRFLGALSADELADQYGQAAIAVFPSVRAASGDQDGLPVALLEAMAAGCAIVASDLPGLAEAVEDGVTGRLVPSGDVEALASAVVGLLAGHEERARLGRAAAQRSDGFSVTTVGRRYVELLDEIRGQGDPCPLPDRRGVDAP